MEDREWIGMMKKAHEIRLFASSQVKRIKKDGAISAQELDVLSRIVLSDKKLTPLELTVLTGLSKSAVSRLIDRLERKELLHKQYNTSDRRSYMLICTDKGSQELEQTYKYYLEPIYQLRKVLGDEEFEALMTHISHANQMMKETGGNL
ncbi:MAG: MarR family winged helix-turn-helix transcriptional regulator [Porcipelethomonas sp.]